MSSGTTPTRKPGFMSGLFSMLSGSSLTDDDDDGNPNRFDPELFDDSLVEKIMIPTSWKALERHHPFFKAKADAPAATMMATPNLFTCFPKNGTEVEQAVMGPDCTVIVLTRSYFEPYRMANVLVVNSQIVVRQQH